MKKLMVLAVMAVLSAGCAGVHANTDSLTKPVWDGGVASLSIASSEDWLNVQILPCLWGGLGFKANSNGMAAKVLPLNVGADFCDAGSIKTGAPINNR